MAQAPYTFGHYLRDRTISERVDSAYKAGDIAGALQIQQTITGHTPWTHFWRAKLIWETGGSPAAELKRAFDLGFRFIPNVPPDSFEVAMVDELWMLKEQAALQRDMHRIQRCEELIDRDQVLASGEFDEAGNRTNLDTLDALIREGGWPSSYFLDGIGVAIVLAHQEWDEAQHFQPYQALIEAECRAGRENWQVAISTLEQRIRYTARNKTDTILFGGIELGEEDRALPMVVAISDRLVANGHKQVWIHAADTSIALAVADRIIEVQPEARIPQETLDMLKAMNFDHPAPLTMERITLVVDPKLPTDRFLYRMN